MSITSQQLRKYLTALDKIVETWTGHRDGDQVIREAKDDFISCIRAEVAVEERRLPFTRT